MVSTVMVAPGHNEAGRLSPEAFQAFAENWRHGGFLFGDDGSTNHTFAVLSKLKATLPTSFDLLRLPSNVGKAEAVRQRFLQPSGSSPSMWGSGIRTLPHLEVIPLLEAVFQDLPQTEDVLGARVKLLGRDVQRKPDRRYLGRVFAMVVAVVVGVEVYDSQCAAKLLRVTSTARALFATPFRSRWIFDVWPALQLKWSDGAHGAEALLYELPLPLWQSSVPRTSGER